MANRKEEEKKRKRGEKEQRQILTKYTGGSARRKIFPHKHVMFHKSSKLSWNELETKMEGKLQKEEERKDKRMKVFQSCSIMPFRCHDSPNQQDQCLRERKLFSSSTIIPLSLCLSLCSQSS